MLSFASQTALLGMTRWSWILGLPLAGRKKFRAEII
jgi:hypothetical protein